MNEDGTRHSEIRMRQRRDKMLVKKNKRGKEGRRVDIRVMGVRIMTDIRKNVENNKTDVVAYYKMISGENNETR